MSAFRISATIMLALLLASCCPAPGQPDDGARVPLLTVATTEDPPVVDGALGDAAWQRAAGFAGMVPIGAETLSPDRTRVLVTRTTERLYVAFECSFPAGTTLQGIARDRDTGKPWQEDAVELFLVPDPHRPDDYYQLIGNSAGSVYDLHAGDAEWNGDWEFATGVGEGVWIAEASIAFSDLGAAPESEEMWRANFCRDVQAGRSSNESWAPVEARYLEPENLGWLRFAHGSPVVRVDDLGEPRYGRLQVRGLVHNPGDAAQRASVRALMVKPGTTFTAEGEDWAQLIEGILVTATQELSVPAGGQRAIELQQRFDDRELGELLLSASSPDGARLYAQRLPVQLQTPLSVHLQPIPVQKRLIVRVESGLEGIDPAETPAKIAVAPEGGGTPVAEAEAPLAALGQGRPLDYSAWPEGAYDVTVTVRAGEEPPTASARFEVKPPPQWLGNDLGTARVVLPPFTPMRYHAGALEVWGRRMSFDESLLPTSITSQGEELLARPMALVATVGGQRMQFDGAAFELSERSPDRAEFRTGGAAGEVQARIDWWQEFDGFTWAELTLTGPEGATLDELSLEMPLRPDVAQMLHGTPNQRHAAINKLLSDELLADGPLQYPFLPVVWVGNLDRGLCWFAESAEHFRPVGGDAVVELAAEDDTRVLRITLIGESTPIDAEAHFPFGLLASPVRPLPEGWSTFMVDKWPPERSTLDWEALGTKPDWGIIWTRDYGEHLTAPLHTPEIVGELVERGKQWGVGVAHYIAPGTHSMAYETPQRYLEEWRIDPLSEFYIDWADETYPRLCLNSSWADYLLWGIDHMIREFGIQGIYHDGGAPSWCHNQAHGCGWRDDEGTLHRCRPIRAYRDYHKRLATLFYHDHGRRDWLIYNHTSDICWLPTLTFCDAHLDGEQYKGRRRAGIPYTQILSRTEVLPEYVSTQWGVITVFLNICQREGWEAQRCSSTFLGHMAPHGVPFYPRHLYQAWNEQIQRLYSEFDIDRAQFHPWWRGLEGFEPQADSAMLPISCYTHREGGMLVVAGNLTDQEREATVSIDPRATGLAADARIRRKVSSGAGVRWEGGELTLEMPAYGFAFVWLQ